MEMVMKGCQDACELYPRMHEPKARSEPHRAEQPWFARPLVGQAFGIRLGISGFKVWWLLDSLLREDSAGDCELIALLKRPREIITTFTCYLSTKHYYLYQFHLTYQPLGSLWPLGGISRASTDPGPGSTTP